MFAMFKIAAAAVLALSAGVAYLASPRVEATTAFTEAAEKLRDARTLSYRCTLHMAQQEQTIPTREFYKDPGLTRLEVGEPPTAVNVMDASRGQILMLDLVGKTAVIQDWRIQQNQKGVMERRAVGEVEHLRSLAGKNGQPVGRRRIGDVEAEGFRVEDAGMTWTVWIDPERKFPLIMETTVRDGGENRDLSLTLSDFHIDPPLDDSLFRLDPPDGYRVRKIDTPLTNNGEEALVNLLRMYAEAADGFFPAKLDDMKAISAKIPKNWTGADDPKMVRFAQTVAGTVAFVQFVLKDAYGYAPDKVKLGEADKILFWYRPKDARIYRAIFGDLHAEDVAVERLPEKPKF